MLQGLSDTGIAQTNEAKAPMELDLPLLSLHIFETGFLLFSSAGVGHCVNQADLKLREIHLPLLPR